MRAHLITVVIAVAGAALICSLLKACVSDEVGSGGWNDAAVLGLFASGCGIWLTWRIYRWQSFESAELNTKIETALGKLRAREQTLAAVEAQRDEVVRRQTRGEPAEVAPEPAERTRVDLADHLSPEGVEAVERLLKGEEFIVEVGRSGSGRGNHPWVIETSGGRWIRASRGGRGKRGWTTQEVDDDLNPVE